MREVVVCAPVCPAGRTWNGSLKATPATEPGATLIREAFRRTKLQPAQINSVVLRNVMQAGNRMIPARQAAVHGGILVGAPAMTVNRVCGSGAQAIASAAREVWLDLAYATVAGDMENLDAAPYLTSGGWWGYRMGGSQIHDLHASRWTS